MSGQIDYDDQLHAFQQNEVKSASRMMSKRDMPGSNEVPPKEKETHTYILHKRQSQRDSFRCFSSWILENQVGTLSIGTLHVNCGWSKDPAKPTHRTCCKSSDTTLSDSYLLSSTTVIHQIILQPSILWSFLWFIWARQGRPVLRGFLGSNLHRSSSTRHPRGFDAFCLLGWDTEEKGQG